MKRKSKLNIIRNHLLKYKSISPEHALCSYGVTRLSSAISDLRALGWLIETRKDESYKTDFFTRGYYYVLISAPAFEKKIKKQSLFKKVLKLIFK